MHPPRSDAEAPFAEQTLEAVRHYYGEVLSESADLRTSACCAIDSVPRWLREPLAQVHPEVSRRFYGCGSPLPPALEGATVLDLGCGSGRDAYVLSQLVGPSGRVIGIDMTAAQLAVAEAHLDWHAERFGYANVEFRQGFIEDLAGAGIAPASVDVVVSNCVVNLSPDKARVLAGIFRVLRPGGELHFADVYADRRVPIAAARDPLLRGECLGGALYHEDFRRLLAAAGCADMRVTSRRAIAIDDEAIAARLPGIHFESVTIRAFRLALEDRCEDYGQVATYLGTMAECPHAFDLDDHHHFEVGRPMRVCGNTADMLAATRYAAHFNVQGDRLRHFGLFDCAPVLPPDAGQTTRCC
jgi:arsenite methyltransferase